jgi:hypothetical protein
LSQIAQALKQAFGIQRTAGADRSLNLLKGCRERVLSPCVEVGDELLVQGQAFHANGKQNTTSAMVSTPGHVSFVVQEVTEISSPGALRADLEDPFSTSPNPAREEK